MHLQRAGRFGRPRWRCKRGTWRKVVCAMERQQEILEFTLEAGRVLLANGGEIFRVQETMQRIAASLSLIHI